MTQQLTKFGLEVLLADLRASGSSDFDEALTAPGATPTPNPITPPAWKFSGRTNPNSPVTTARVIAIARKSFPSPPK